MTVQITISEEVNEALRQRAVAAGFDSVEAYVADLVIADLRPKRNVREAISQLRQLRKDVAPMSSGEIAELVREGRN